MCRGANLCLTPARVVKFLVAGIMVLAVRRPGGGMHLNPGPDHLVQGGDYLIVMGETISLRKLEKMLAGQA